MVNTLVLLYCRRPRYEPYHISLKHIFTRNLLFQSQQRKQEQFVNSVESLCPLFSENLRYIKFKNLDEIAITNNVYLYKHYQKTKTLCRHVSRFPTFTAWG